MSYWHNLTLRDRWTVVTGGIFTVILIGYFYIWSPFVTHIDNLQQQVHYQQQLIGLMQHALQQLQAKPHSQQRKTVSQTELLSLLANNLKRGNLANFSHQLLQTQDGNIQLEFKNAPFDLFINWLIDFYNKTVFDIDKLEIKPATEAGTVQLTIIFKSLVS